MSSLDLDAIEALADEAWNVSDREPALDLVGAARSLVAEVRRLRSREAAADELAADALAEIERLRGVVTERDEAGRQRTGAGLRERNRADAAEAKVARALPHLETVEPLFDREPEPIAFHLHAALDALRGDTP